MFVIPHRSKIATKKGQGCQAFLDITSTSIYINPSTPNNTNHEDVIESYNTDTFGCCLMEELPVWCDIISYDAALLPTLIQEIDQPFSGYDDLHHQNTIHS